MKNIKDIVIGIFAIIGFSAIVTGFTEEIEQEGEIGTYQVATSARGAEVKIFRIDTRTGDIVSLKFRDIKTVRTEN